MKSLRYSLAAGLLGAIAAGPAWSACCYFSAKDKDVNQPGQKAFITWDPTARIETFTVQPRFEGNAEDFGMVIPTPGRPKLDEMPRDFFQALAVYTILKERQFPESKLVKRDAPGKGLGGFGAGGGLARRATSVRVLEAGVVGSLDYKILTAERADDLYAWLDANHYNYAGDQEALEFYIKKHWYFTVMKIDPKQMKRGPDGSYQGEVTPTRFRFESDRLVYPLRITRLSVKDRTEALFYVQAPVKMDLPGDMTYQFQWVPMLQNARGWYTKGIFGSQELPGGADQWLSSIEPEIPALMAWGRELGYGFQSGMRPQPNAQGQTAATLEWAKRLGAEDIGVLNGTHAYSDVLPNVDEGFDYQSVNRDSNKRAEAEKVIQSRIDRCRQERPAGYLVRQAPDEEIKKLKVLAGHVQEGQFLTKVRKVFTPREMNDDLYLVPASLGTAMDCSEYEEILPTSPP